MTTSETIRLYGTALDSIVDGPGLRYSVFVQGCSHACPGCHNPQSQPTQGGTVRLVHDVVAEIQSNKLVHDVTLSGGEPFEQAAAVASLARCLKELGYGIWTYTGYLYEDLVGLTHACAQEKSGSVVNADKDSASLDVSPVTSFGATDVTPAISTNSPDTSSETSSGTRTLGLALDPVAVHALLNATDVLVDGPFVASLRSLKLAWRGSSNQRLIDVSASRMAGTVVLWEAHEDFPTKPASW